MAECLEIIKQQESEFSKILQKILPLYYEKLFPYHVLYKWLSYGTSSYFLQREIALTLPTGGYIRYACFESEDHFLSYIVEKNPEKIDVGCIYNVPPRDAKMTSFFKSVEKELVFDIDMSDYDEVRTCCKEANICNSCWKFLVVACKILDKILRKDFGFKHLLWVFSGRRGIHCWVCDKVARTLTNEERNQILNYIVLIQGGIGQKRRVKLPVQPLHSSIKRAVAVIETVFVDFIVKEQNILGTTEGLEKFLNLLQDGPRHKFENVVKRETSEASWKAFVEYVDDPKTQTSFPASLKYIKEEILLHHLYPRLDGNVTKRMDHLLKAPFSVHPKTGNISVPLSLKNIANFDVNKTPTIHMVLTELNEFYRQTITGGGEIQDDIIENLKHTSLRNYVQILERLVETMKAEYKKDDTLEF